MDEQTKYQFQAVFFLLGEVLERIESAVMCSGTAESKLTALQEIAQSQENIKAAWGQLSKAQLSPGCAVQKD